MAYKVLGQTATTAASSPIAVNLIYNGANYGSTSSSNTTANLAGAYAAVPGTSDAAIASGKFWTSSSPQSSTVQIGTSLSGSKGTVWVYNQPGSNYSQMTLRYGWTTSNTMTTASAVPVSESTTYYVGLTITEYSSPFLHSGIVYWLNSSGGQIGTSTALASTSTSGRKVTAVSSPAGAAYAAFQFQNNASGGNYYIGLFISDFCMSTDNSYATTYQDPTADPTTYPGYVSSVAPFNYKFKGYYPTSAAPFAPTYIISAGATSNLYVTPAGSSAVVSTLSVANLGNTSTTYRYAVVPSGQTLAKKHWIALDISLAGNATTAYTIGQTLSAGDKIVVAADTADIAFTAFGNES